MLREIASRKKTAFMRSLIGTVVEAITLQSVGEDLTEALTDNFLKLKVPGHHEANRWVDVKVEGVNGEMLVGRPVADPDGERGLSRRFAGGEPGVSARPSPSDSGVHGSQQAH